MEDVSFKIGPGQTLGILGETGSGKTTLVNLVGRFYDPTEGEVLIDGKNAKEYPVRQMRRTFQWSCKMYSCFLTRSLTISLLEIRWQTKTLSGKWRVVADADTFISRMPQGYETIVGERGVGLSGGQNNVFHWHGLWRKIHRS